MTRDERKKKKAQLKKLKARLSKAEDLRRKLEDRLWEAEEREGSLYLDIESLEAELAPKRQPFLLVPALLPTDEPLS